MFLYYEILSLFPSKTKIPAPYCMELKQMLYFPMVIEIIFVNNVSKQNVK